MNVEIITTTGSWFTKVGADDLGDEAPGAAALHVQDRLLAGRPLDVWPERDGESVGPRAMTALPTVFNPAHLVAVREVARPSRRLST